MNHGASIAKSVSPIRNLVVRLCPRPLAPGGSGGFRPSLFLAALLALAASLSVLLAAPWPVSGQQSGQEVPAKPTSLTATVSADRVSLSWDDPGDSSITGYQVLRRNRDTDATGDFTVIEDDTGSADTGYTDSNVQPETPYVYRVKARNVHGLSDWSGFVRADTPAAPENSAASGSPAITGTAQVHETLSADTAGIADANGLSNVEYAYRWVRTSGGVDTDIADATGSTFLLTYDDLGHTIRVRVSFTDDDGYPETLTSAATGAVARPPNSAPTFNDGPSTTRSVPENSAPGTNVGLAVAATDSDAGDTLAYSLSGADASSFSINSSTGQL